MRKISVLLLLSILTAGCAASGQPGVRERIDASEQNRQVLEARVDHVEDRLGRVENELEQLRRGGRPVPKPVTPVTVEHAPAKVVRISRNEAALPQETGHVDLHRLGVVLTPHPAPSGESGAESPEYPYALDLKYSDHVSAAPADAHSEPVHPVPPPGAPDNGPGLVPPQSLSPAPESPAPPAPAPQKAAPTPSGEKSLYEAALALYHKGEYGKAQEAFQAFSRSHPGSVLAPNAMYWEGESLYSLGLYDQAIMIFMGVVNKYPKHDKAAASLLKIGHAYERMKDMDNARFYWQILLDDFPKSAPATLARKRLGIG
jgi:tol-pal system protein YbgF